MSIGALNWAFDLPITGPEKGTLVALANHADAEGTCHPSVHRLVLSSGYSERAVRDALRAMQAKGLISVSFCTGSRSSYTLHIGKLAEPRPKQLPRGKSQTQAPALSAETPAPDAALPGTGRPPPGQEAQPPPAPGAGDPGTGRPQTFTNHQRTIRRSPLTPQGGDDVGVDLFPKEPPLPAPPDPPPPAKLRRQTKRQKLAEIIERVRPEFTAFYARYPRKEAVKAAETAYAQARRDGATADDILRGLNQFQFDRDPKLIPHPSTWLNKGRWLDEARPEPPQEISGALGEPVRTGIAEW